MNIEKVNRFNISDNAYMRLKLRINETSDLSNFTNEFLSNIRSTGNPTNLGQFIPIFRTLEKGV